MKIRCIQTCSDWNNKMLCIEGRDYLYNASLSSNKVFWIIQTNLQFHGVFQRENFISLSEYRDQQINSILDE